VGITLDASCQYPAAPVKYIQYTIPS
jgi:hypothetical protein